jgi:hypothetical protein
VAQAALQAPELPPALVPLWHAFAELNSARGAGGMGPANITYQDIAAWQAVGGVELTHWEVFTIKAADRVFIELAYKALERHEK